MPAVADAGCLPSLNSPNLRKLGSSSTDKESYIRSYLRSQEAHLASYAIEGKALVSSWDVPKPDDDVVRANTGARDFEMESGFGTPLLKPRARLKPLEATGRTGRGKAAADTVDVPSKARGKHNEHDQRKSVAGDSRKPKERPVDRNAAVECPPEPSPLSKDRAKHSGQSKGKSKDAPDLPKKSAKKQKEKDVNEEHLGRLAERRDRRRAKKAIVAPRPNPTEEDHDQDQGSDAGRKTGRGSKKGRKGKGLNMPAGLALMHGFSATNIGKNRLTLDPAVGVFSKGKASAKTTVKKLKLEPSKPHLKLFSERQFLNKTKPGGESDGESSSRSAHDDGQGSEDAPSKASSAKPQAKSSRAKQKRARTRSDSLGSSGVEVSEACEPTVQRPPTKRQRRVPRADSPLWDIELEGGNLPSGSRSATSVHSKGGSLADGGTIVLDTRTAEPKWAAAAQGEHAMQQDLSMQEVEPVELDGSETSSISPSNSASQSGIRHSRERLRVPPPGMVFSKYFPVPDNIGAGPEAAASPGSQIYARPPPSPVVLQPTGGLQCSDAVHGLDGHEDAHYVGHSEEPNVAPLRSSTPVTGHAFPPGDLQGQTGYPPARATFAGSPLLSGSPLLLMPGPPSPALSAGPGPVHERMLPLTFAAVSPRNDHAHTQAYAPNRCHWRRREGRAEYRVFRCSPDPAAAEGDDDSHIPLGDWGAHAFDTLGAGPAFLSNVPARLTSVADLEQEAGMDFSTPYENSGYSLVDFLDEALPEAYDQPLAADHLGPEDMSSGVYPVSAQYQADDPYRSEEEFQGGPDLPEYAACGVFGDISHDSLEEAEGDDVYPEAIEDPGRIEGERDGYGSDPERGAMFGGVATATDLGEDLGSESDESDADRSVLGSLQRFSQGRALLMGVSETGLGNAGGWAGRSRVEEDVARRLVGHWQRQKF